MSSPIKSLSGIVKIRGDRELLDDDYTEPQVSNCLADVDTDLFLFRHMSC